MKTKSFILLILLSFMGLQSKAADLPVANEYYVIKSYVTGTTYIGGVGTGNNAIVHESAMSNTEYQLFLVTEPVTGYFRLQRVEGGYYITHNNAYTGNYKNTIDGTATRQYFTLDNTTNPDYVIIKKAMDNGTTANGIGFDNAASGSTLYFDKGADKGNQWVFVPALGEYKDRLQVFIDEANSLYDASHAGAADLNTAITNAGGALSKTNVLEVVQEIKNLKAAMVNYNLLSNASEQNITDYKAALSAATATRDALLAIDSNLSNLKAANSNDYGKFDAAKIDILLSIGVAYKEDSYSTANLSAEVVDATNLLNSVTNLSHGYYMGGDLVGKTHTWYRVKLVSENKYLTYDGGNKFLDEVVDAENQIWYLTDHTNKIEGRYVLSVYSGLKQGNKQNMTGGGQFFGISPSGTVDGVETYTVKSGGTGNPTISSVNLSTGAISYGEINANRDLKYRIALEELVDFGTEETTLTDGSYDLSFIDTELGLFNITENKISIDSENYTLTRYGTAAPYTYAIGSNAEGFVINATKAVETGATAAPRPGFVLVKGIGTSIISAENNDSIISTHYYTLDGAKVSDISKHGLYIVKKLYKSNKVEVSKVLIK